MRPESSASPAYLERSKSLLACRSLSVACASLERNKSLLPCRPLGDLFAAAADDVVGLDDARSFILILWP